MEKRERILVLGIAMDRAGTEQSFLAFARALEGAPFEIDLLLAERRGELLSELPPNVRVLSMKDGGELFTCRGARGAARVLARRLAVHPAALFPAICAAFWARGRGMRVWEAVMRRTVAPHPEAYDLALAYWGDKTMFYAAEKVRARRKIAWLHFDYAHPPRCDALYGRAFAKMDRVVTVSASARDDLADRFPSMTGKFAVLENGIDADTIRARARIGETFSDGFCGVRILTVGRVSPQKGIDLIPQVLEQIKIPVRWYVIGAGEDAYVRAIRADASSRGVGERLVFLGGKANPLGYMRDCDVYVQPSRYEGKPIAVEEAKVLAKPIVVSAYASAQEQLCGGALGMIAAAEPTSLAAAITEMICRGGEYASRLARQTEMKTPLKTAFLRLVDEIEGKT